MPQQERRVSPRTPKAIRVLVFDPEDAMDQPYVGWILDRSVGGLCLAFKRAGLKVGDVFLLQPASGKAKRPSVAVKVKNGRWKNGRLELGCVFVRARSRWAVTR